MLSWWRLGYAPLVFFLRLSRLVLVWSRSRSTFLHDQVSHSGASSCCVLGAFLRFNNQRLSLCIFSFCLVRVFKLHSRFFLLNRGHITFSTQTEIRTRNARITATLILNCVSRESLDWLERVAILAVWFSQTSPLDAAIVSLPLDNSAGNRRAIFEIPTSDSCLCYLSLNSCAVCSV